MDSNKFVGNNGATVTHAREPDWLARRLTILPRPLRFLTVGSCGLIVDLGVFTALPMHATQPLVARAISLAAATLVTWRLNRALTFPASGRRQRNEALRYAGVTTLSQGSSFVIFSVLVLTILAAWPRAALIAGAAAGAIVAYAGHTVFAFVPVSQTDAGEISKDRS